MYMYIPHCKIEHSVATTDLCDPLDALRLQQLLGSGLVTLGQQTQLQFAWGVEWVGQGTVHWSRDNHMI